MRQQKIKKEFPILGRPSAEVEGLNPDTVPRVRVEQKL